MKKSKLYIMTGLPYAGKSTLTKELVNRFNFEIVSVDLQIEEHRFDTETMTQDDWNLVYSEAYKQLESLLKNGEAVVFDMGHLEKSERNTARAIAEKANAEAFLIYINTPIEDIKERRLKNIETKERGHLEDVSMDRAFVMFEEPQEDEHPILYNQTMNLEEWINENIRV